MTSDLLRVPPTRFQDPLFDTPLSFRCLSPPRLTAERGWRPSGGVTMSIHKLTAGSGYDYLTRQVAALGCHREGPRRAGLLLHRTRRNPRRWVGSGLAGIDGLHGGDPVTAEQMQALFGVGLHPLAAQRQHSCRART